MRKHRADIVSANFRAIVGRRFKTFARFWREAGKERLAYHTTYRLWHGYAEFFTEDVVSRAAQALGVPPEALTQETEDCHA